MNLLKYSILALVVLVLPNYVLVIFGVTVGSLTSYLTFILLIVFYFLKPKSQVVLPMLALGILYYLLSGLNNTVDFPSLLLDLIKYLIFIICGTTLVHETKTQDINYFALIGASSILIHSLVFSNAYGRYSGLYLNPNTAGFVCLIGFALSYRVNKTSMRLLFQFIFIVGGILTLSRFFILIWLVINLMSIFANKKNIKTLVIGCATLFLVFAVSSLLNLNQARFSALESVFSNNIDTKTITEGSRNETWALHTNTILESPLLGNGYRSMQGLSTMNGRAIGVHNTYLLAIGEAGIIPFLLLILIYITLLIRSLKQFKSHPEYAYVAVILITQLLVSHNYFDSYIVLFLTIWLYIHTKEDERVIINYKL